MLTLAYLPLNLANIDHKVCEYVSCKCRGIFLVSKEIGIVSLRDVELGEINIFIFTRTRGTRTEREPGSGLMQRLLTTLNIIEYYCSERERERVPKLLSISLASEVN